jgi:hypothetical protein
VYVIISAIIGYFSVTISQILILLILFAYSFFGIFIYTGSNTSDYIKKIDELINREYKNMIESYDCREKNFWKDLGIWILYFFYEKKVTTILFLFFLYNVVISLSFFSIDSVIVLFTVFFFLVFLIFIVLISRDGWYYITYFFRYVYSFIISFLPRIGGEKNDDSKIVLS